MQIVKTSTFNTWLDKLRDRQAKRIIISRIDQLAYGLLGDIKPVGEGISELRIHYGPGYRIYCKQQREILIILLCGGDKSTQERDIAKAKGLAKEVQDDRETDAV